jgi:hypothetical protein
MEDTLLRLFEGLILNYYINLHKDILIVKEEEEEEVRVAKITILSLVRAILCSKT